MYNFSSPSRQLASTLLLLTMLEDFLVNLYTLNLQSIRFTAIVCIGLFLKPAMPHVPSTIKSVATFYLFV